MDDIDWDAFTAEALEIQAEQRRRQSSNEPPELTEAEIAALDAAIDDLNLE